MNLRYFLQDDDTYLAADLDTDDEDYCLVIEIQRVSRRKGFHTWEATGSYRPIYSFVHLPRMHTVDIPHLAMQVARIKYSEF